MLNIELKALHIKHSGMHTTLNCLISFTFFLGKCFNRNHLFLRWKLSWNLFTMRWKKFVKRKVLCQSRIVQEIHSELLFTKHANKIVRKSWIGRGGAYCARVRSRFDGKIYCPSSHYSFPILRSETRRARRSLENGELVIKNFLSF